MSDHMEHPAMDPKRENQFWLRIFRDHSQFIMATLAPNETALLAQAQCFYQVFDQLLQQADQEISQAAAQAVMQLRSFLLGIIDRQLAGQVPINLPPGALNEMVDEADAYLRMLGVLPMPMPMPMNEAVHLIHQHLMWLPNNGAHAALAAAQLDPAEASLMHMFHHYHKLFSKMTAKVMELQGLMRDNPRMTPALIYTTQECIKLTGAFLQLLEQYMNLRTTAQVLAISPPLLVDHFMREAAYYLEQIS